MKWFDNTALTIVIIGAVNWLLVGIFRFDLVAFLFGNLTWLSRIIYALVGLCGLYLISMYGRISPWNHKEMLMYTIRRRGINVIIPSLLYAFIHFYLL